MYRKSFRNVDKLTVNIAVSVEEIRVNCIFINENWLLLTTIVVKMDINPKWVNTRRTILHCFNKEIVQVFHPTSVPCTCKLSLKWKCHVYVTFDITIVGLNFMKISTANLFSCWREKDMFTKPGDFVFIF